jgi:phenylpyruvate tautomerase PptA (4-oxalocrotonate tautomerase family)
MPYINISLSKEVTSEQKEQIKARMGKIITLVPGKSEEVTMIDISGSHSLYMGGRALENGAFVDIRLKGKADIKGKEDLTEAVFKSLKELLGTKEEDIYLNITEFDNWGSKGRLT